MTEYQARLQEYQNIELALRNQVALYNNKYEEFEKTLTRSNKMFGGFKEEMESVSIPSIILIHKTSLIRFILQMSDKIVKLERETAAWKQRWEKTQNALLEMASEKQKSDQEIVVSAKQMATLHKLCRTLQSERTQLLAKLKQNDISTSKYQTENEKLRIIFNIKFSAASSLMDPEVKESTSDETLVDANLESVSDTVDKTKSSELKSKKTKDISDNAIAKTKPEIKNEIKIDPVPSDCPDNEDLITEMSNVKINDNGLDSAIDSDIPITNIEDVETVNGNVDSDDTPLNDSDSLTEVTSLDQSTCELKKFSFPQTDTFSFTYNGNILNELKCNELPSFSDECCGESSQAFTTPFGIGSDDKDGENSQKFVLKKATHSSKRKVYNL